MREIYKQRASFIGSLDKHKILGNKLCPQFLRPVTKCKLMNQRIIGQIHTYITKKNKSSKQQASKSKVIKYLQVPLCVAPPDQPMQALHFKLISIITKRNMKIEILMIIEV